MKLFSVNYTTPDGIEIFSKAQEAANMEILESWCYTRGSGAASILAESRPFPGNSRWCSAWLNSREVSGVDPSGVPSVPGKIPGGMTSCPTPEGSRQEWCYWDPLSIPGQLDVLFIPGQIAVLFIPGQITILFIPGQIDVLFTPGGGVSLLTPASVGRRALGRPIYAHRAIATAFAWLPSWGASSGRWYVLWQAGIAYLQYCRRLDSAI